MNSKISQNVQFINPNLRLPFPAAVAYRLFPFDRSTNKKIHATLNLLAVVFIVFGLVAVVEYHLDWGYNNFYTLHSWIGIITFTCFIAMVIFISISTPESFRDR